MTTKAARLLGFAPDHTIDKLQAALSAVAGPAVWLQGGPGLAAVVQSEPPAPLIRRSRKALLSGLHTVQRRLELCCQAGPFLPMDPAAATCPCGVLPGLLATAWEALGAALARRGEREQWDITLRWPAETVVAQHRAELAGIVASGGKTALAEAVAGVLKRERDRREAALLAALGRAALACAPAVGGGEAEFLVTVLVPRGGEAAIEAALGAMDEADVAEASVDMRGPLPPVSFAPVRLLAAEPGEVASAWRRLDLPERIDATSLHRRWRLCAASVHPDRPRAPAAGPGVSDMTEAYRLLRDLLPEETGPQDGWMLNDLLRRAGHRLVIPPDCLGRAPAEPATLLESQS